VREILPGLLWIGNAGDLRDPSATLAHGVAAVVDLAASEPPATFPRDIIYCRIPLCDGAENTAAMLKLAVSTTSELVRAKIPTLVACSMGMSRSPAIAAAALAQLKHHSPDEALARIAEAGPLDVDAALWRDLKRTVERDEVAVMLALVVIRTEHVSRLIAFYRALGMAFVEERHGTGPIHHSAEINAAVFEIYPASAPADVDASTRLGFRIADVTAVVEALRSIGAPIVAEPKAGPWGTRAVVRDPDGRAVELYRRDDA